MIKISKADIIWNYIAQFFSLTSGLITLPLILKMLTVEEIALNYIFLTISSLVLLFDFGFSPQFSRNVSYVYGGAQSLKKEGIEERSLIGGIDINYRLIATLVKVGQYVYLRLALFVLFVMLTIGTLYIYNVTEGFHLVPHTLLIWTLFSVSTAFAIYYEYYNFLLTGKGAIKETKIALLISRIIYIILTFLFLYIGWGLLGVVLANFIAPFVNRILCYQFLFTEEFRNKLKSYHISKEEINTTFNTIWYNAKKLGLVFVGAYAITKFSMFLAGLYLSKAEVASYGLMIQLVGVISAVATTFFSTFQPKFASLRVENNTQEFTKLLAFSMNIFLIIFVIGAIILFFFNGILLKFINSNVFLPDNITLLCYILVILLESNHSNFATIIITKNSIPFVKPAILSGICIAIGSFIVLKYNLGGILSLVIVQGLCQAAYNNWKWPLVVLREFHLSGKLFIKIGIQESLSKIKKLTK
ncbi:O-unit flippase-like protein [Capnocytophaga leadbetteri]|uniref:O-unit flippase-like protein n=1 Tax=Capnocytophaga leadbetteri TaxID=327575 RepID=UPI0028EFF0F8|nr:O-unit flippase-like protein [Capnocytophaga leadbetteri]